MRYQSMNEVPKKGEPIDHRLAVRQIEKWFFENRYDDTLTMKDYKIKFKKEFIEKHKLQYDFHNYDLVVFNYPTKFPEFYERKHILIVIEVGQSFDDKVTLPDGKTLKISKSRHSKAKQTMNDQISEDYIREYYPDAKYITIDKSDCFNSEYLDKVLNDINSK